MKKKTPVSETCGNVWLAQEKFTYIELPICVFMYTNLTIYV